MAGYIGNKSSVTLVDGYNEAEADAEFVTKTGDSMTGGLTITTADNTNQLTIVSTDADANAGPNLNFRRNSASPADGDLTGQFTFTNNNDAGEGTDYATMYALSADVSNGSEDAAFYIKTMSAGTLRQRISIDNNATTFNEGGENLDFRVESDNSTHMLFVDAGNNRVGIGTSTPAARATIKTASNEEDALLIEQSDGTDVGSLRIANGSFILKGKNASSPVQIQTHDGNEDIEVDPDGFIKMETAGSERLRIDASGNVGIGTSSPSTMLHVENSSGNASAQLTSGTSGTSYINMGDTANVDAGQISYINNGDAMAFTAGSSERMRITSAGAKNFGVHQSESGGFNIFAGAGSTASYAARFDGTGTGASNVVQITNGYGEVGSIKIASNGTTTNYNTGSDYRLKTDVQPVTNASARIQSLNPVNFEWIRSGTRTDGFLAHEAQAVVPDCVSGDKDAMKDEGYEVTPAVLDDDGNVTTEAVMGTRSVPNYQGIDQSKLVPLLTAALQEALTEIASLKTRVEALET